MNIVNKLTVRQLKLNRKRTLVTIIGTIISAAMITAVATLGLSFMDLMKRQTIANSGEWHVAYENVNKQQLEAIQSDPETKTAMLIKDIGYAPLLKSVNLNKPYLFIRGLSKEGYEHFPIELVQGRLPQRPDEIVISDTVLSNAKMNYKIGDAVNLSIGHRYGKDTEGSEQELQQNTSLQWENDKVAESFTTENQKSYTIVGIIKSPNFWEYTWSPGYTALSYIDSGAITAEDTFNVLVINKHINNAMFARADRIVASNKINSLNYNNELLRCYGVVKDDAVRNMLFILSAIIMVIIVIGSVSLIYNAFAISVSERSRYLGMLSSVGATRRQKRNSVFFEGAIIGAISIPLGILAGYLGLGVTYIFINPIIKDAIGGTENFQLRVYPSSLITAILISIATILISTYVPAIKASHISAIDAIRQSSEIKIRRKQVRTSWIIRMIFGMEGDLGLKNLKRNRGRYRATLLSLIISMVLFLVVSSFTDSIKKSALLAQEGINFDIQTTIDNTSSVKRDEILHKLETLPDVKARTQITSLTALTNIKENDIADYLKTDTSTALVNGKYPYQIELDVLDAESLASFAKEIGIDVNLLNDGKNPSAIVIDTVRYKDDQIGKYVETKAVKAKVGEQLDLSVQDYDKNLMEQIKPLKIAALTNIMPMGVMSLGKSASFHVILSKEVFDEIVKGKEALVSKEMQTQLYYSSSNPIRLQENIEAIQNTIGVSSLNVYNVYLYRQREEQMILLLSVFTYAFIILITCICVANITNTISTSIALRRREFAMLKSVGITPKGFSKMLNFESAFYGMKALLYGLPISFAVMYLIHTTLMAKFEFAFSIPWVSVIVSIISVFIIVGVAMLYSGRKVKNDNIVDTLKQEII